MEIYVENRPRLFAKNLLTPINSLIGPKHTPYALCLHIFAGIEHDDLTALDMRTAPWLATVNMMDLSFPSAWAVAIAAKRYREVNLLTVVATYATP